MPFSYFVEGHLVIICAIFFILNSDHFFQRCFKFLILVYKAEILVFDLEWCKYSAPRKKQKFPSKV